MNAIMTAAIDRLNKNTDEQWVYELDRDENAQVVDLEMFRMV